MSVSHYAHTSKLRVSLHMEIKLNVSGQRGKVLYFTSLSNKLLLWIDRCSLNVRHIWACTSLLRVALSVLATSCAFLSHSDIYQVPYTRSHTPGPHIIPGPIHQVPNTTFVVHCFSLLLVCLLTNDHQPLFYSQLPFSRSLFLLCSQTLPVLHRCKNAHAPARFINVSQSHIVTCDERLLFKSRRAYTWKIEMH